MYPISYAFRQLINGRNRNIQWRGTLTLTNGTVYDFDADNIIQGSGIINGACDVPGVGGAYSPDLQIQLFLSIDPRQLEGAEIALYVRLTYSALVGDTWGDASIFFWGDLGSSAWGDSPRTIYTDVPMGRFTVSEAKRAINSIKITAYDNITKFNKALPAMDDVARTPFVWLRLMCNACGVTMGLTSDDVKALPNGRRSFTYADVGTEIKTYRDLLSHLSAIMASIAVIDRFGKLVLMQYGSEPVAEITPDYRFRSDFEDYQCTYTGAYAQYKAQATQEYYRNVGTLNDTGLILDLGCNVFLQISNASNRSIVIQAIIDALKNKTFTPYDVSMPFNPAYDLMDVLEFSGGHTPTNSYGPITSITRKIGGAMTVQCATPEVQANPIRENSKTEGLTGTTDITTYASTDFFILIDSFPKATTIFTNETITTEVTVNCTADNTTLQIAWTGAYTIGEDATVVVKIFVDDENIYEVSDVQTAGSHVLNVTTGHEITSQGSHTVQVTLQEVISS